MMTRPKRLGTFALLALFAALELLAPAPLLHAHCSLVGSSAGARTADGSAQVVKTASAASTASLGDCPACNISGLWAVVAARLAVGAPFLAIEPASSPKDASPPAPRLEDLRGRAPPAA
jgi:hypothetical protein